MIITLLYLDSSVSTATSISLSSIQPWWSSLSLPDTWREREYLSIAYTVYILSKTCVFCPISSATHRYRWGLISDTIWYQLYIIFWITNVEVDELEYEVHIFRMTAYIRLTLLLTMLPSSPGNPGWPFWPSEP